MVFRKQLFIIVLYFLVIFIISAQETDIIDDELIINDSNDYEAIDGIEENDNDNDTVEEDAEEEFDKKNVHDKPKIKELDFTLVDVIDFCAFDKTNMIYKSSSLIIPLHDVYKFDKFWITHTQLPTNSYNKKLKNLGSFDMTDNPFKKELEYKENKHYLYDTNRFSPIKYDYEMSLTRLYSGLGDFKQNFAHITFFKDSFLTLNGVNFRGDFKAISEIEKLENQRLSDIYLQLDYNNDDLHISGKRLTSNHDLHRNYYTLITTSIPMNAEENMTLNNLNVQYKYFFIGYFNSINTIKYLRMPEKYKFENESYILGAEYENNINSFVFQHSQLSAQKNISRVNKTKKEEYSLNPKYNAILQNDVRRILLLDFEALFYDNFKKLYTFTNLRNNLIYNFYSTIKVETSDINRSELNYLLETYQTRNVKIGLGYEKIVDYDSFDNSLYLGKKSISQYNRLYPIEPETFLVFSNDTTIKYNFNKYQLKMQNYLEYNNFKNDFIYLPVFFNALDVSLIKFLNFDNKMALGSRIKTYGDALILSAVDRTSVMLVPTNSLIDIYFSVGITKLFDINIEFNNIGRAQFVGNEMYNDFHFSTYMTWYFFN
jgi:hypothetical protein